MRFSVIGLGPSNRVMKDKQMINFAMSLVVGLGVCMACLSNEGFARRDPVLASKFRHALSAFDTQLANYPRTNQTELLSAVGALHRMIKNASAKSNKPSPTQAKLLEFGQQILSAKSKAVPLGSLQEYRRILMELTGKPPLPVMQPSYSLGKEVFSKHCVACHGTQGKGDGPLATRISAEMRNFSDQQSMGNISIAMHYNWLLSGIGKMPSFREVLEAREFWSVLFYIQTLPYKKLEERGLKATLYDLVYRSNTELRQAFGSLEELRLKTGFQLSKKR